MWFDTLAAGDGGEGAVYIQEKKKEINSSAYIMRSILLNIYYYMY
jgi:hypothetical protein